MFPAYRQADCGAMKFNVEGEHRYYPVTSYEELQDIDLTKWIEG
ncbi:MAG TPA: hypothetical protein VFG46_11315 [Chryseolinea sp.]|nr:hypothetical protein [Chryseolinea sp.]